jgi:hypothetical protein
LLVSSVLTLVAAPVLSALLSQAPVLLDDMHMLPGEMKRAINDKVIEIWECMRGETSTFPSVFVVPCR